ncbi:MAG TPA: phosphatase PAP2 family protein [Bradyrhizobium sp.]|nr:phosphatase PAP2 family protein [Bradyrhizobium sp.]
MALATIRPTAADVCVANAIAAHTRPGTEQTAQALTWGADEHILVALAVGWWAYTRTRSANQRRAANHVLLTTVVASLAPHLFKTIFDQERPDRLTVRGHWRGVPLSGRRLDSFPSGHAVHIGALASAASVLPPRQRAAVWSTGAALVLTRIVLLAHWTSDVAAGLLIGGMIERMLRPITGFGRPEIETANSVRSEKRSMPRKEITR